MRPLDDLGHRLAARSPRVLGGGRRAAVAVLIADAGSGPARLLFIERARRLLDPWSGDMALPGGLVEASDVDARAAAERETLEEVGVRLADAAYLGRLDDVAAGIPLVAPLALSAFVYRLDAPAAVTPNHEVQATVWASLATLLDRTHHVGWGWGPLRLPGVRVAPDDRRVVWGLTYQVLQRLFAVAGVRFPPAP